MLTRPAGQLRFNILGPLEGWFGDQRLRLGGAVQERVLTTLLLEPGRVLPVSRLVTSVWSDDPPATSSHQVRKAVAILRQRIPQGDQVLVTDGPGYRAVLTDGQLDLIEFNVLTGVAKDAAASGRTSEAVGALHEALALWRGSVLSGEGGPVIEAAATAIEERRLAAQERLFELRLALGEAADLVVDLREVVALHPLRETLRGQLMIALYQSGRQAEALEEFAKVRELLVEELGVSPGGKLAALHEGILRESPELAGPRPAVPAPASPPSPVVDPPCTLPYDMPGFTGRKRELRKILDLAQRSGTRIIAIDGMGGSGKTSLAIKAAHLLSGDYPEGQLYVDLRGYAPEGDPVVPVNAMGVMLRALGVPEERVPDKAAGRADLWRRTVSGKRLLIFVDNASRADDVRSLIPVGTSGCLVLVTARRRLFDLDGAEWISLGVMAPEESADIIAETLGAERVAGEPEAAAELARLCGHLPLALRIAVARLGNRPRWTVRYMADRLRDETRRLDELSVGERSVAATLRLSYQALDEETRAAFRLLALHPGGSIDAYAAGALLGGSARDGEDVLELLLDVHLVQQPEIGLYAYHDLVGAFARRLLGGIPGDGAAAAVERLLGYYFTVTERACATLFPGRREIATGIKASDVDVPDVRDTDPARAWFAREQNTLISLIGLAVQYGDDRYAVCLARNLAFYLNAHGLLDDFESVCRSAVDTARLLGDDLLLGVSLANLGVAYWELGRFTEGIKVAEQGWSVAARMGDRATQAHSDSTLGLYKSLLGRFPEALEHLLAAVDGERELGLRRAEAESQTVLSTLYEQWGRYAEAASAARRALDLCRELGQPENEFVATIDLAIAQVGLGEYAQAEGLMKRARAMCDDTREPGMVAMAMALSADIAQRLGHTDQAAQYARTALEYVGASASPLRRVKVENMVGRLFHRRGEHVEARALHERAWEGAAELGYRPEEAYARLGLAQVCDALGDDATAARHREVGEEMFADMGVPAGRRRR
ncbi:tetratricopeptide repeat protein (plasmid) [Streptomyces sp. NBC_01450]|uniref:AfsR/SARP family transcriptional regulator n=1 Tax=Streptomyces sp. NBC_01450 TaxID=2903871 RepID=UPI002E37C89E|nr:BTAD domain-containing putative transcriptional regulator [Streptomyces sp. NBC_01450]